MYTEFENKSKIFEGIFKSEPESFEEPLINTIEFLNLLLNLTES